MEAGRLEPRRKVRDGGEEGHESRKLEREGPGSAGRGREVRELEGERRKGRREGGL